MSGWKRFWPTHGRTAGAAAVVVVWIVAFQIWWVAPRQVDLVERQDALARRRTELTRFRQEAGRLAAAEAGIADLEARLAAAHSARADARDTAVLLRRLELLAGATALSVRGYSPQPALLHELHAEWPSRLELSGGYDALQVFFEQIDGCLGEVAIGDLAMRAADAADDGATVSAAFTLTAFAFNGAEDNRAEPLPDDRCLPVAGVAADAPEAYPDPFSPPLPTADSLAVEARAPGLAGLRAGELTLQGLVLSSGQRLAVVVGPGGETYFLRGGEQLLDGSVVAVDADAVVFLESSGGAAAARQTRRTLVDRSDRR